MALRSRFGLRSQLLALFAGLAAAFLAPVYFTGASASRALLHAGRDDAARGLGRAVAAHVEEVARHGDRAAVQRALSLHSGPGGVLAGRVTDHRGALLAETGHAGPDAAPDTVPTSREHTRNAILDGHRVVLLDLPLRTVDVHLALDAEVDERRADPVARLLALLAALFAAGLAFFTWILLGRLFVRPLDALVGNAEKIAAGARTFAPIPTGTAETETLAASLRTMSLSLFAKEKALQDKVRELGEATLRLSETSSALVSSEHYAGVGKLAAGMAHEIGNPIAALLGLQELVLSGDLTPEEQLDFVARMHKETTRIHGVLRDLLDYARSGGNDGSLATSGGYAISGTCDAVVVVDDLRKLLAPQRNFKDVALDISLPPSLVMPLPAPRLLQVLLNLAMNAADAMNADATNPDATSARPRVIHFLGTAGDAEVRLSVSDTGPGVPPSLRAKIFEPFVTTKEVGAGTGLGLAVCKGIVEAAGGRLELDADATEGCAFVLTFPRA